MRKTRRTNRTHRRKYDRFAGPEDINPMNYLSNLSDVMLILAVGIMLALILHWNVEISSEQSAAEQSPETAASFSEEDLQGTEEMPESAEQMGSVYYDPDTGKYYYQIDRD